MNVANPPTASAGAKENLGSPDKEYGVVIATLAGVGDGGTPLIAIGDGPALSASTLVDLDEQHIGMRVAVQFDGGNRRLPLVMGLLRGQAAPAPLWPASAQPVPVIEHGAITASIDDEEIVLTAKRRITLRCGAASITLDADGNVEIRGKHVLSRAAGQNRIKGSSVSLN
ncbi:hypothetical protein F2P45_15450 [Massilia sp. CCM 8733]|uniref:DUF6484 domain-containing protein n=1 Tax=Massilia mucilaginosa TaxID=2609282 RepID=A0ABX0NUH6_9BURK|nr:DUF6484 domain-containing protein [Massilia mucilaginosa]NHZ90403.1 hypothetical protein [Massilia mucilaginosa]